MVRGHKCLKNFKLTCIICNSKISNYVSGATFVVCVSLEFLHPPRSKFQQAKICFALVFSQITKHFKASGLELFLRLLEDILNSCNKNFAFCRGACNTHELQWNRDATVHSQYRMAQTSQGKNCARKVWILNSWLEFHHFKKALLKNCQRLWWTISTWLFLDIFILRIYYITDKLPLSDWLRVSTIYSWFLICIAVEINAHAFVIWVQFIQALQYSWYDKIFQIALTFTRLPVLREVSLD